MTIAVVDFPLFFHRMYYGAPDLTTSQGFPSGFEFMMLRNLELLRGHHEKVILCYDNKGTRERQKLQEKYKANRDEISNDLYPRLAELLPALAWRFHHLNVEGFEADDLIWSLAVLKAWSFLAVTNDKDLYGILRPGVTIQRNYRGKTHIFTLEEFKERYVISPHQWYMYRSFCGDPSDSLPAIPYISKAIVAEACRQYVRPFEQDDPTIQFAIWEKVYRYIYVRSSTRVRKNLSKGKRDIFPNLQVLVPRPCVTMNIKEPDPEAKSEWEAVLDRFEFKSLKDEDEF